MFRGAAHHVPLPTQAWHTQTWVVLKQSWAKIVSHPLPTKIGDTNTHRQCCGSTSSESWPKASKKCIDHLGMDVDICWWCRWRSPRFRRCFNLIIYQRTNSRSLMQHLNPFFSRQSRRRSCSTLCVLSATQPQASFGRLGRMLVQNSSLGSRGPCVWPLWILRHTDVPELWEQVFIFFCEAFNSECHEVQMKVGKLESFSRLNCWHSIAGMSKQLENLKLAG